MWLSLSVNAVSGMQKVGAGIAESGMAAKTNATDENTNVMLNVKANGIDRIEATEVGNSSNCGSRNFMLNVMSNYYIWLLVSSHIWICRWRAGTRITNIEVTADVMLDVKAD